MSASEENAIPGISNELLTPQQRFAAGVRARKHLARSGHAVLDRRACSATPLAILHEAERGRIPALVALKHERMAESPFAFFRGAAAIMAADLEMHPNTGILTQLCGDAHVLNLGAYAAPDGKLVFDINDFDETIHGPFEWDLKRLATSLLLAGRAAGVSKPQRDAAAHSFVAKYRTMMRQFAAMPVLELARFQIRRLGRMKPIRTIFAAAERSTGAHTLEKLTEPNPRGTGRRFRDDPPLLRRVLGDEARAVLESLAAYAETLLPDRRHFLAQFRPVDVAFKVVGTGSIGLRDYCVYMEAHHLTAGKSGKLKRDFTKAGFDTLFLQIKEEAQSVYAPYLPADLYAPRNEGRRVAAGQRAMQFTSDPFLGYTSLEDRDFLVRQLNDHKASLDLSTLTARSLETYADICGEIFARGHARAGDPIVIAAYLGDGHKFDEAICEFAHAYADKTEDDWKLLRASITETSEPTRAQRR